jgi:DNA/RNA endonuclease G, NUC1
MAPAAGFNCDKETLKTFSYLNSALQHQGLNRGVWKALEAYERELALTESPVKVKIDIKFSDKPERVPAGAAIPLGFTKIITTSKRILSFYFPNEQPKKLSFKEYKL